MDESKYMKNRLDKLLNNRKMNTTMTVKSSTYSCIFEEVNFVDQDTSLLNFKENSSTAETSNFKHVNETILIYGLPKIGRNNRDIYMNDIKNVNEVLEKIGLDRDNVFKQRRMNIERDIILIIFKAQTYRKKALLNKLLLRNEPKFENVYINKYLKKDILDSFFSARREVKNLNKLLTNRDEKGRPFGIENGQKFHWAVRNSKPVKVFIEN